MAKMEAGKRFLDYLGKFKKPTQTTAGDAGQAANKTMRQTLFGTPKRKIATVAGGAALAPWLSAGAGLSGGLYSEYSKLPSKLLGISEETPATGYDASKVLTPAQMYEQDLAAAAAIIRGQAPSQQEEIDRLARYSALLGGGRGAGAATTGVPSRNVMEQQAAQLLRGASAGTGTATSGLTPVAGPVAAQADSLVAQGGTLDDYLRFMNRAADAAGISRDNAARERLAVLATNQYFKRQNAVSEQLKALELQALSDRAKLRRQPSIIIDKKIEDEAIARRRLGGNRVPLEEYINQIIAERSARG